ncbi:uncharacterized protein [Musca autumnalis]|uniref:uncharacterized protein n=1 Tax=Musca autumnalis TaxID=221902 RepID=UPI003CF11928
MDDRTVPPDVMKPSSNDAIIEFVDLCSEGEEDNFEKENMAKSLKAKSSLPIEKSDDDLSASYPTTSNATVACTEETSNKTSKEVEGEISNKFLQPSEVTKEQAKEVANGNKRHRLSESSKEQSVVDPVSESSILMYISKESDDFDQLKSIGDKRRCSVDVHSVIAKLLIEADSTTVVSSSQASTESFKSPSERRKTSEPQERQSNKQTSNSIPKKINTPDRNDDSDEDRKYALPETSTKPKAQCTVVRKKSVKRKHKAHKAKKKFTVVRKKSVKRKHKALSHKALNVLNNDCQMYANNNRGCVLCNDKPRNLTNHYIRKHKTESYISRLSRSQLDDLLSNTPFVTEVKGPAGYYYSIECKFCNLNLNEPFSELYDHYSSHTGEYAYYCNKCRLSRPYRPDIESHQKHTKLCSNSGIQVMYSYEPGEPWYLYYCNICNFVQLNEANILKHLREHHGPQHLNGNIQKCILAAISDVPDTNTKSRSNASSSKSVTTTPAFNPLIIKSESMDDEDNRLTPPPREQTALNYVIVNSTRENATNDDSIYTLEQQKLHEDTSRQQQTAAAVVVVNKTQKQQPPNMATTIASKSPSNTCSTKSMTTTPVPSVVGSSLPQQSQAISDLNPTGPFAKVFEPLVIKSELMDDEDNNLTPPRQQSATNSPIDDSDDDLKTISVPYLPTTSEAKKDKQQQQTKNESNDQTVEQNNIKENMDDITKNLLQQIDICDDTNIKILPLEGDKKRNEDNTTTKEVKETSEATTSLFKRRYHFENDKEQPKSNKTTTNITVADTITLDDSSDEEMEIPKTVEAETVDLLSVEEPQPEMPVAEEKPLFTRVSDVRNAMKNNNESNPPEKHNEQNLKKSSSPPPTQSSSLQKLKTSSSPPQPAPRSSEEETKQIILASINEINFGSLNNSNFEELLTCIIKVSESKNPTLENLLLKTIIKRLTSSDKLEVNNEKNIPTEPLATSSSMLGNNDGSALPSVIPGDTNLPTTPTSPSTKSPEEEDRRKSKSLKSTEREMMRIYKELHCTVKGFDQIEYYMPKAIGGKRRSSVHERSVIAEQSNEGDSTAEISSSQTSTESFESSSKRRKTIDSHFKHQKRQSSIQARKAISVQLNTPEVIDSDEDSRDALPERKKNH